MGNWNPMSDILNAHFKRIAADQAAKAESDRVQQQQDNLDEQRRQFDLQHKQARDQFDSTNKLRQAIGELTAQKMRGEIQNTALQTGQTPAGATETQTPTTTTQQDMDSLNQNTGVLPNQPNLPFPGIQGPAIQRNISFPATESSPAWGMQIPDRMAYAKQQADAQTLMNQPKIQEAIDIANGKVPSQIAAARGISDVKLPNELLLQNNESLDKAAIEKQRQQATSDNLNLTLQKDRDVAQTNGRFRMAAAMYKANNPKANDLNPEDIGNQATLIAAGQVPMATDAKSRGAITTVLKNQGFIPPPKGTDEKLNAMGSLGTIFKQFNDYIEKDLSDNVLGAAGTAIQSKNPFSDVHNDLNAINLNDPSVARLLEGVQGRQAMGLMKKVQDDLASGTMTKTQAHANLNKAAVLAFSKVKNEILGSMSPTQQELILKAHPAIQQFYKSGLSPTTGKPIQAISTDGGIHYLGVQ